MKGPSLLPGLRHTEMYRFSTILVLCCSRGSRENAYHPVTQVGANQNPSLRQVLVNMLMDRAVVCVPLLMGTLEYSLLLPHRERCSDTSTFGTGDLGGHFSVLKLLRRQEPIMSTFRSHIM